MEREHGAGIYIIIIFDPRKMHRLASAELQRYYLYLLKNG
jgi:hypothetical protein